MAAPQILTKQYGPFTGGVWLIVIVGGVGLGLVLRRFTNKGGGDTTEPELVDGGETVDIEPAFVGGGTQFNQGQIVSDVLEAIQAGEGAAVSTDPASVQTLTQQQKGLQAELARLHSSYDALKAGLPSATPSRREAIRREMDILTRQIRTLRAELDGLNAQIRFVKGDD